MGFYETEVFLCPYVSISQHYILNVGLHSHMENSCLHWKALSRGFQMAAAFDFFSGLKDWEGFCEMLSSGHDIDVAVFNPQHVVTCIRATQNFDSNRLDDL